MDEKVFYENSGVHYYEPERRRRKPFPIGQIIAVIVITVLLVMVFYPIYVLLAKSLKDKNTYLTKPFTFASPLAFSNYATAWKLVSPYIGNSMLISTTVSLLTVLLCSVTAFAFTAFTFKYKETIFMFILTLMMVPGIISLIPQYLMFRDFGLIGSYWGVIIPMVTGNTAFGVFLLRTFFKGIPRDLTEAAVIDGAPYFRIYLQIILPLSLPILLTLGINVFLGVWNDYLWTLLILQNAHSKYTITIGLVSLTNSAGAQKYLGIPLAGYVLSSIPLIIIFAFTSKQFIKGLTSGALKM